jgi:hypothetical protein
MNFIINFFPKKQKMTQLPSDCLNEIFEYLYNDVVSLHACLLVNRLWCQVSVRILWRNVCNYNTLNFNTLIVCLPDESKKILSDNGIIISASSLKPPIFNYASFCKVLSIDLVGILVEKLFKDKQLISSQSSKYNINIVSQEIFKLIIKQAYFIKKLEVLQESSIINFISCSESKDCLKNLTELHCSSNISSKFFYQLSRICYNIQSITIEYKKIILNELYNLISVQKNLEYFDIRMHNELINVPSLLLKNTFLLTTKLPNNLLRLKIHTLYKYCRISLSFIAKFSNLQELELSFRYVENFVDFKKLQYIIFPQLQILTLKYSCPRYEFLIKFLENNGKNLKVLYLGCYSDDNSLNLAIAKFCPKLKKLSTRIKSNELETLKIILDNCQYLESIKIWCGGKLLSEKEAFDC